MKNDIRNWKCLLGMHQYDQLLNTGPYEINGEFIKRSGVYYTYRCTHCGKIKMFRP